jgi:hypothetical protein
LVPDRGDLAAEADAHAALRHLEAEFRRLRDMLAALGNTTRVIAELVTVRDEIIVAKDRQIRALTLTLTQERSRRLRPKSERGGGPARHA